MDGRSIVFGSLAAALCGAACVGVMFLAPGGQVVVNQVVILAGGTAAGLVAAWAARPAAPRPPGALARLWPLAVPLAGAALVGAAFAARLPAARSLARDVADRLPRGCDDCLRDWPDSPSVGDCRKLEWELRGAEREVRAVCGRLDEAGARPRDRALVDVWLRRSFVPAEPAGKARRLPPVGSEQQGRIGERLRERADALAGAAEETGLPALVEWAERVRSEVRQLSPDAVSTR